MLRQGTENPYAGRPTYGKDICELMRRINALEARTIPMDSPSAAEFTVDYNGGYMLAVTPSGSSVWVVGWKLHEDSTEAWQRYRVNIWSASPPAGSTGTWTIVDHGELYSGDTAFRFKWPMVPEWCGCGGDGRLYLKIAWGYESGAPRSTFIRTNSGWWFSYTRLVDTAPAGMIADPADAPYKRLGRCMLDTSGLYSENKCWVRPVSGGIEVHGFCGWAETGYPTWSNHTFYNIETYNEDMALTDIRIFYVGNADAYYGGAYYAPSPVGIDCDGASEDYGANGWLNLKGMVELDPSEAWPEDYEDWPQPAERPEDAFTMPLHQERGYPIFWVGSGTSVSASATLLTWPSNIAGTGSGVPYCGIQQLTSTKNPSTGEWSHTLSPAQRRLGRLGPDGDLNPHTIRIALSDTDPNVPGKVFAFGPGPDGDMRLLRWRTLERRATETEWFGYPVGAARVSLGTPDHGVTVPGNNALLAVGAGPCAEHIVDMRTALKRLFDDNWACVLYKGLDDSPNVVRGWSLAAFDFWEKYAGVIGGITILEDEALDKRCDPALYMALAQANHSATRPYQQYGLEIVYGNYWTSYVPSGLYWEFRKADADVMDNTPMHDVDIGEIRALVELLEGSYNTVTYPVVDSEDWLPDMNWRPEPS